LLNGAGVVVTHAWTGSAGGSMATACPAADSAATEPTLKASVARLAVFIRIVSLISSMSKYDGPGCVGRRSSISQETAVP
jgi:hypothetical protein